MSASIKEKLKVFGGLAWLSLDVLPRKKIQVAIRKEFFLHARVKVAKFVKRQGVGFRQYKNVASIEGVSLLE